MPAGDPPRASRPLLARLLAPAGPPPLRLLERAGARVLALPGRYCVTYLVLGPDAVLVVDVGSAADVPLVRDALSWLGRPVSAVRGVLPTHLHFDHVMGIDPLARAFGVPVALGEVAHAAAAAGRRLRYPHWIRLCRAIGTWPLQGLPFPPWADWRAPFDVGFPWGRNAFRAEVAAPLHDGDDLPGCPGWRILHTPGHADDAVCLHHADAGFLIAGDTVRNFYGGEWNPLLCDREAYRRTQARLRSLRVDAVMPGHGPVVDGPDVVARLWTPPPFLP